jgi:hypothetical protein
LLEQQPDDIRATLALSSSEARNGTIRTLTLPGGRQITIPIPAGTHDGQEIRLAGQGLSSLRGGPVGALILTIFIASTEHPGTVSYPPRGSDSPTEFKSVPGSTTNPQGGNDLPTEIKSVIPPPPPQTYTGFPSTDPGGTFTPYPFQTPFTNPQLPAFSQTSVHGRPWTGEPESTQQRPGFSRGMLILLAVLALLLIGAGGLIYYVTASQRAQTLNQSTATAQANTTSTAQPGATGLTQSNATLTAAAQTNTEVTATAYAPQISYSQAISGTPAITDPLNQQDSNNWDQNVNCAFIGGAYHAIVPQQNSFASCSPNTSSATFGNFALQVQMTIIKGDYGGLLFRSNSTGVNYYFLSIDQTGYYSLSIYKNDSQIKTLSSGPSSAFKSGLNKSNLITIVAQASNLALYINGQLATNVSDNTYTAGDFAMIGGDNTHSTDVAYSNVKVWNL